MVWKRKWAQCSTEERPKSFCGKHLNSAFQISFASLIKQATHFTCTSMANCRNKSELPMIRKIKPHVSIAHFQSRPMCVTEVYIYRPAKLIR